MIITSTPRWCICLPWYGPLLVRCLISHPCDRMKHLVSMDTKAVTWPRFYNKKQTEKRWRLPVNVVTEFPHPWFKIQNGKTMLILAQRNGRPYVYVLVLVESWWLRVLNILIEEYACDLHIQVDQKMPLIMRIPMHMVLRCTWKRKKSLMDKHIKILFI